MRPDQIADAVRSPAITISRACLGGCVIGVLEREGGELSCMLANVLGPRPDRLVEALPLSCEQRPRRLLEAGPVAGHDGHEPVGRLLRLADAILALVRPSRLLHQL